jgi:Fur family ferric uptake transcriptional regulator
MLQHKMEIYGICAQCLKERIQLMPLIMAKPGERLVLKEFSGGIGARTRLLSMGLRLGDKIEVITNNRQGQLAIAADYKRYVLGRGLAQKILVEPIKHAKRHQ